MIDKLTIDEFEKTAADFAQPGDCALFSFGRARPLKDRAIWWFIERAQRRMLAQLSTVGVHIPPQDITAAAGYTHAGAFSLTLKCVEITWPRGRRLPWSLRLSPGDRIIIRRPLIKRPCGGEVDADEEWGRRIAYHAAQDVGKRYPLLDLLRYWLWSWGVRRLLLGHNFLRTFRRYTGYSSATCARSYWTWCLRAETWPDMSDDSAEANAAGHYPAELTLNHRLRTVAAIEIVAEQPATTCHTGRSA